MYVFGIDIPIMELLFIFMVLLFAALIAVFFEIRSLRKLILKEQNDIYRFEEDLNKLNPMEKEEHTKALEEYVKNSLSSGIRKKEIEKTLTMKGWPKQIIKRVMQKQ